MNSEVAIIFLLHLFWFCRTESKCEKGPIQIHQKFSFMGSKVHQIFIKGDRVEINNENLFILFNPPNINFTRCEILTHEIVKKEKQEWLTKIIKNNERYSDFEAEWTYSITWMVHEEKLTKSSKFFQIILTSNNKYSFVIMNFIEDFSKNMNSFQIGIKTTYFSQMLNTTHKNLVEKSNIGIKGKWLFLLDESNFAKTLLVSLVFNIFMILFLFLIIKE